MPQIGMSVPQVIVSSPAMMIGGPSALAAFVRVGLDNRVSASRPPRVLIITDRQKTHMYFLPVHHTMEPDSLAVNYMEHGFLIDLSRPFERLNRTLPLGYQDIYAWEVATNPVTIGETTGRACFVKLNYGCRVQADAPRYLKAMGNR